MLMSTGLGRVEACYINVANYREALRHVTSSPTGEGNPHQDPHNDVL